jgi:hypothetical protein
MCISMSCSVNGGQHERTHTECSRTTLFSCEHTLRRRKTAKKIQHYSYRVLARSMACLQLPRLKWTQGAVVLGKRSTFPHIRPQQHTP